MKSQSDEEHVFKLIFLHDLQECRDILLSICCDLSTEQKSALIRYAIICYARPFTKNRGKFFNSKKLKPKDIFSDEQFIIHDRICMLRDKYIAHSDLDFLNPEYLNPNAMGLDTRLSEDDYDLLFEQLLELSKIAFNSIAQSIANESQGLY